MSRERDAYDALVGALAGLPSLKGYGADDVVQPPGLVVYPPQIVVDTQCGPTDLEFEVYLVVKATEKNPWRTLLDQIGEVLEALEDTPAVVTSASPGTFSGSGTSGELPAYLVTLTYPI